MSKSRSHDWPDMINMLIINHVTYIGFGNLQRLALRNPQTPPKARFQQPRIIQLHNPTSPPHGVRQLCTTELRNPIPFSNSAGTTSVSATFNERIA